jgi:hypothetical protein
MMSEKSHLAYTKNYNENIIKIPGILLDPKGIF